MLFDLHGGPGGQNSKDHSGCAVVVVAADVVAAASNAFVVVVAAASNAFVVVVAAPSPADARRNRAGGVSLDGSAARRAISQREVRRRPYWLYAG